MRWENKKTWVPRVSVCFLHIPEDTLNSTLAAQQQPEALRWQQTQFSKQGASEVRAFWGDEVFSVCAHSGWWQRHFCPSPAELSLWPPSPRNDIKMMPGERFGRVMRIDVDFLSFLSAGILMLSRIVVLIKILPGRRGQCLRCPLQGLRFVWHALKTSYCNFFPLHIVTSLGWMQFIDPESTWWHWFGT